MADLKKLDSVIDQLETHSRSLEPAVKVHRRLDELQHDLDQMRISLESDRARFHEATGLFESTVSLMQRTLESQDEYQKELLQKIQREFASFSQTLGTTWESHSAEVSRTISQHRRDIQDLLEKHKSDIQVELRQEGAQIQRGLENAFTERHLAQQAWMKQELSSVTQTLAFQTRLLVGVGAISVASIVAMIILLIMNR